MHQKGESSIPIGGVMWNQPCAQCTVRDSYGNVYVRYQEYKKIEDELQKKTSEIELLKEERRNDEKKCDKYCINTNFPIKVHLLGASSNRRNFCI